MTKTKWSASLTLGPLPLVEDEAAGRSGMAGGVINCDRGRRFTLTGMIGRRLQDN